MLQTPYSDVGRGPPGLHASLRLTTADQLGRHVPGLRLTVMQALATAGALVALADGHLEDVERDELVGFIHRQDFPPTISQRGIAKAFDNRVRELQENYNPNVVIEALRPLAGLSLTSVVIRTAERVGWRGYPSVESLKIGRHGRTYRRASEAS